MSAPAGSHSPKIRTTKGHNQVPDDREKRTLVDGKPRKGGFGKGGWGRAEDDLDYDQEEDELDPRDPMYDDELTLNDSALDRVKASMVELSKESLSPALQEQFAVLIRKQDERQLKSEMPAAVIRWALAKKDQARQSLIDFLHSLQRHSLVSQADLESGLHLIYDAKSQTESTPATSKEEALAMVVLGIDRVIV